MSLRSSRRVARFLVGFVLGAMVGAAVLVAVPRTAEAQSGCNLSVSSSSVFVGQSVTITGSGFAPNTFASISIVNGGVIEQGNANGSGVFEINHSFGTAGSYSVQGLGQDLFTAPCPTPVLVIRVSAAATTTTAAPTTTTTLPIPQVQIFVEGKCSVDVSWGPEATYQDGMVAPVGTAVTVTGSGFLGGPNVSPVEIDTQHGFPDLAVVAPDGDGNFSVGFSVPDWPAAYYHLRVHQDGDQGEHCFSDFLFRIDRPIAAEMGECAITIWEVKAKPEIPAYMWGQFVTEGTGFAPGEMVVLTLANSQTFDPDGVMDGPQTPVGSNGRFLMVFAPPKDHFDTIGPAQWWARSNSCIAKYSFQTGQPVTSGLPDFTVTPEMFLNAGFYPSTGSCSLDVWRHQGEDRSGVPAELQPNLVDHSFLQVFGNNFDAGSKVHFFVDGVIQPSTESGSLVVTTNLAGQFRASAGKLVFMLSTDFPYVLTAQTTNCTASIDVSLSISGEDPPVAVVDTPGVPGVAPTVTAPQGGGLATPGAPEQVGADNYETSTVAFVLGGLGLIGAIGGLFLGSHLSLGRGGGQGDSFFDLNTEPQTRSVESSTPGDSPPESSGSPGGTDTAPDATPGEGDSPPPD